LTRFLGWSLGAPPEASTPTSAFVFESA